MDYVISFAIGRNGRVLDQHSLSEATKLIDNTVAPSIRLCDKLCAPLFSDPKEQPLYILKRIIAFLGNSSDLDHCQLDNAEQIHSDSISSWGTQMVELNHKYGMKILGGCCGTDPKYINFIQKQAIY